MAEKCNISKNGKYLKHGQLCVVCVHIFSLNFYYMYANKRNDPSFHIVAVIFNYI